MSITKVSADVFQLDDEVNDAVKSWVDTRT